MKMFFSRRGSSLLEVLIAIMVTSLLSGVVILYGSASRKQTNVYVETVKLAQVILKAKAQAISIYYNPTSLTCGYGVKIEASEHVYSLFRYVGSRIEDCANIASIEPENIKVIERFPLTDGVVFKQDIAEVDEILFVPPDPRTYLWARGVKVTPEGSLHILTDDGAGERTIIISTGGQISY